MKILILECNEEELRANRIIIENISEALSGFTRCFAGVDITPEMVKKYYKAQESESEEEAEEADDDKENQRI